MNSRQVVENVPEGVHVDFLRAERSLHRWAHDDIQRIHAAEELAASEGAGVQMHVLEDSGHWVITQLHRILLDLMPHLSFKQEDFISSYLLF